MDILIIGAGAAGLNCARALLNAGHQVLCLEATDRVGGRLKTDREDGFLFDHGFQILLPAYPEVQRSLNLSQIDLRDFCSGARIRIGEKIHTIADPIREPRYLLKTAFAPIGSLRDKLRIQKLRLELMGVSDHELLHSTASETGAWLKAYGFSDQMIERFFSPFFSGVFLERDLSTSAAFFKFLFKMFALGPATLPANGIEGVAQALAAGMPADCIKLKTPVRKLEPKGVQLESGESLKADQVILATDAHTTVQLMRGLLGSPLPEPEFNSGVTYYFSTSDSLKLGPWLYLNSNRGEMINHLAAVSEVADTYAPAGQTLLAINVIGKESKDLDAKVQQELKVWFGIRAQGMKLRRRFVLPRALPKISSLSQEIRRASPHWLELCGDFTQTPSLQGALASGRMVAERLIQQFDASQSTKPAPPKDFHF